MSEMTKDDMLTERLLKANEKLLEAYEQLDPKDQHYWERLKLLEGLHEKVLKDVELELTDRRKGDELDIEQDRIAVEKRKVIEAERSNRKGEKLEISKQLVMVGTTVLSTWAGWKMFKRSTAKEADEAILTTTDQTVVKSGLGSIFRFGRNNTL